MDLGNSGIRGRLTPASLASGASADIDIVDPANMTAAIKPTQ